MNILSYITNIAKMNERMTDVDDICISFWVYYFLKNNLFYMTMLLGSKCHSECVCVRVKGQLLGVSSIFLSMDYQESQKDFVSLDIDYSQLWAAQSAG